MRHTFKQTLDWPGQRNAIGKVQIAEAILDFSIPKALDGPGQGTNPDELLLSSAAGCYLITLATMLERSSISVSALKLSSELIVEVKDGIFKVVELHHFPVIKGYPKAKTKMVERIVHKADERCMISNALKGNVEIKIHPTLESGD